MDLQIYIINGIETSRDVLPTMKYLIKVISKMGKNTYYVSNKKREIFLDGINLGDMILLEYPPIVISKSGIGGGIMSFSIKITNLNSEKSISVKAGVSEDFWYNLDEFRIIE